MKKQNLINLLITGVIASQIIPLSSVANANSLVKNQPLLLAQETQNELTEEMLNEIMTKIETAEKEENLQGILQYLAPYVLTSVTVDLDQRKVTTFIEGKEQHEEYLNNSFKNIKSRKIISSYSTTQINGNGQMALVTRVRARELDTENGNRYLSLSTDKIRFAMINNEPKIINVESSGWLEPISN